MARSAEELVQRHSTATTPRFPSPDWFRSVVGKLDEQHKFHSEMIVGEQNKPESNFGIINEHQPKAELYYESATAIRKLIEQVGLLTETLKNRVIVALADAKEPPWVATHVHYKGDKYRFLRVVENADHEELEEMVMYDNEARRTFVLSRNRWESITGSGRPRYRYVGLEKEEGT